MRAVLPLHFTRMSDDCGCSGGLVVGGTGGVSAPVLFGDFIDPVVLPADPRCTPARSDIPPISAECARLAVKLVRQRARNAYAQRIIKANVPGDAAQIVALLDQPLKVQFRASGIFVYQAWDGGANGGAGGIVENICAAGVTWTDFNIEVGLADNTDNRVLRLVLWETGNAMQGRLQATWPDGSGGYGDGPVVQMLADRTGVTCESLPNMVVP